MKLFGRTGRTFTLTACILVLVLLLAACGSANNGSQTGNGNSSGPSNKGKGCKKIGVLLPETATSARWDNNDRPELIKQIPQQLPGATVDYNNAEGNADTQLNQAEADLTR